MSTLVAVCTHCGGDCEEPHRTIRALDAENGQIAPAADSKIEAVPSNPGLISLSAALLLAAVVWPSLAKAARRRQLTTTRGPGRTQATALLDVLGPAALTTAGMVLLVAARFL